MPIMLPDREDIGVTSVYLWISVLTYMLHHFQQNQIIPFIRFAIVT